MPLCLNLLLTTTHVVTFSIINSLIDFAMIINHLPAAICTGNRAIRWGIQNRELSAVKAAAKINTPLRDSDPTDLRVIKHAVAMLRKANRSKR
jgi:hypothetical protein